MRPASRNFATIREKAAALLKVDAFRIRIEWAPGKARIGVQELDSPTAEAVGIEYTFDPNFAIGEGATLLDALLDLAKKK